MEIPQPTFAELTGSPPPEVLRDGPPTFTSMSLTGWFERNDFHPLLAAFILFVVTFVLFQGLATVVALVMIVASGPELAPDTLMDTLEKATVPLITGNTVGQFLGMAVPVLLLTRLHTRETGRFLRFAAPDPALLLLGCAGLVGLLPVLQWFGQINETIPLPQFFIDLEQAQVDLIERILGGDIGLSATIFALAVTPAICEEILFRGYLQRQFERAMGPVGAMLGTGVLFGLYHFRLTQAVPLIILGVYMGFLVWRTGSIWVVVAVHLLNNTFAIVASNVVASNPDLGIRNIDAMQVPPLFVVGGAAVLVAVFFAMQRRVQSLGFSSQQTGDTIE